MRRIAGSVLVLLAVAAIAIAEHHPSARGSEPGFRAEVAYVVDGDTLRIREDDGELAYVRLVGIDTPEDVKEGTAVECGSTAAARSMERLAPEGASVYLRYDSVADHEDTFGRTLAHAFVDGRRLELIQLRRGLAFVYDYHDQDFDGRDRFYAAADRAREEDRGSWRTCDGDFHSARPGVQN
jgi:endonuclease YncB( thermonuclease family)